jgi:hypothetical protein
MRGLVIGKLLVVMLCVVAVLSAATCLADDPATAPGDPVQYPPGCKSLEPTPVILSDFTIVLVTVMSQLWL